MLLERILSAVYTWWIVALYFCYGVTAFGLAYINPDAMHLLTTGLQVFLGVVLAVRFHPFQSGFGHVKSVDADLIFASAMLLLVNAGVTAWLAREVSSRLVDE